MKELGQMLEQKNALEYRNSDLFALKAKCGPNSASSVRFRLQWTIGRENVYTVAHDKV